MRKPNRLINEKSPYLLQHAFNPIEWYPWGNEAFERARKEDKPIFLSIGYSTCHWCHVMENESFEDHEVARLMNETFICIKVDREERPDIDNIYMNVCQMITNSGGWPLTIIMTPDKKPFHATTYIPKKTRLGIEGLLDLIPQINRMWQMNRHKVEELAEQIRTTLKDSYKIFSGDELGIETLDTTFERLTLSFDERYGGFGNAPKFPTPHNLLFLLHYWKRRKKEIAIRMTEKTLQAMLLGGIFDHLGFGFHRYSTDPKWLVPHFEKMLYDQAMITITYIEAYQASEKEEYKETAQKILDYIFREMTASEGGFNSAEDADSEGEEGKFYFWTMDEIRKILPADEANIAIKVFNIEDQGNFFDQAENKRNGKNILHLSRLHKETATMMRIPLNEFISKLEKIRHKLLNYRESRVRPQKDDKILADWNGLMIAALAKAFQVFNEKKYLQQALKAINFILEKMRDEKGRLYHRYREGEISVIGFLDDYAFIIWGLIELYEACFEEKFLKTALELTDIMIEHFWDEKSGGFYYTADDAEEILVRKKEIYDGAIPSGNSVALMNLLRLSRVTVNSNYEEKAFKTINAFSGMISNRPENYAYMMLALDFAIGPTYEVIIAGHPQSQDTEEMLRTLRRNFIPNIVIIFQSTYEELEEKTDTIKFPSNYRSINGKATAYVCRNQTCQLPTTNVDKLLEQLHI